MKLTELQVGRIAIGDYAPGLDYELIQEEHQGNSRWSSSIRTIFKVEDKFYSIWWERAATEMQEHYFEEQEAMEVFPVEKKVIVYEEV